MKAAVEEVGIDTRALIMDEEVHTTLAFVHTHEGVREATRHAIEVAKRSRLYHHL